MFLSFCNAFFPNPIWAELPSIRFDRIQPLGLNSGQEVEVDVIGRDTEDVKALRFDHPGLTAEFIKSGRFKVKASSEIPAGTYEVRLVGRFGVSNPRLLGLTRGLKDVAEVEPNNVAAESQTIEVNSAINGTSDGNGQDVFRFSAKKGDRISIDCQGQKLGSQLDANLVLTDAAGQVLASNGDYHGRDPFLDFVIPVDGEFQVIVNDLIFRGGLPYRLIASTHPNVENVFPRVVQAGQTTSLTALGSNLNGTMDPQTHLESAVFPVSIPSERAAERGFSFLDHPTDYSVSPTAATFMLNGLQIRPPLRDGALRPATLMVTDQAVQLDKEPNNDRMQSQTVALPVVLSGRFDQPRDADWFELDVPDGGGGEFSFEVYSERIAGQADPYVGVYDDQGNSVGEHDDYGPRVNAFDGHIRDPFGTFNLQPKKKYHIVVQDRYGRGGFRYQYVLTIRKPIPDFDLALIHSENPGPAGLNVLTGGAAFVDVILHRHHGFSAPITITASGLPKGVQVAETHFFNSDRTTVVFSADVMCQIGETPIKLLATSKIGERIVTHEIRPYTRVWADANPSSSQPQRELILGVRESAPYSLRFEPNQVSVESGKDVQSKIVVTRNWTDCKDKLTVIPLAFPGPIQMPTVEIPVGLNEVPVKFTIQNGARPGDYSVSVLGQCQVPYNKDPSAKERPNTLVSTPSRPLRITVTEPAKK